MLDGLKGGLPTFKMRLNLAITAPSGTGIQYGGAGTLTSFFTQDYTTVTTGVALTATNATAGAGPLPVGKFATLDIPVLSISQSYSHATPAAISTYVEFQDCRAIVMPTGVYRLEIGTIDWFVNGVSQWSSSAGWTLTSGMAPTPSSFPLWGIAPVLIGNGQTAIFPLAGCVGSLPVVENNASGSTTGGWEIEIDGVWVQAPIELFPHSSNAHTGSLSGANCNEATINWFTSTSSGGFHSEGQVGYGSIWTLPNWDHDIVKMFGDYEELIFRWGFPRMYRTDADIYTQFDCEGEVLASSGAPSFTEIYPLDTQFLAGVTDSAHVIENPITRTKYAPCLVTGYELINTATTSSQENWYSGTFEVQENTTMAATLTHSGSAYSWVVDYNNSITHPFSSYGLYFPKDTDSSAARWDLLGADSDEAYWLANRQQHMTNPALPGGENTRRRTNIIAEALDQNGVTGATNSMIGCRHYWGSDLLQRSEETYPTSLVTDASSAPRFTSPTMGATVTVDGSGITI